MQKKTFEYEAVDFQKREELTSQKAKKLVSDGRKLADIMYHEMHYITTYIAFADLMRKLQIMTRDDILKLEKQALECAKTHDIFTLDIYVGKSLFFIREQIKEEDLAQVMREQLGAILFDKFCFRSLLRINEVNYFRNNKHTIAFDNMTICITLKS